MSTSIGSWKLIKMDSLGLRKPEVNSIILTMYIGKKTKHMMRKTVADVLCTLANAQKWKEISQFKTMSPECTIQRRVEFKNAANGLMMYVYLY